MTTTVKLMTMSDFVDALAHSLAELPMPPGEYRVRMNVDKRIGGDRSIRVTVEELPKTLAQKKRRDPQPIEGHRLKGMPFMKATYPS